MHPFVSILAERLDGYDFRLGHRHLANVYPDSDCVTLIYSFGCHSESQPMLAKVAGISG